MKCAMLLLLAVLVPLSAGAQRNCKKGIPCGGSCISAAKTCRVGTQPPDSASRRPQPSPNDQAAIARRLTGDTGARTSNELGAFVGSVDGNVYYSASCSTAWKLTPEERIYFRSEQEAVAAGYHRSRAKNC